MTAIEKGKRARNVDIKKHYEIMAQRFPDRSSCEARRKAIQTFKGRLRAFLLIFQQRRKQIRQERASTLLACFPIEKKKGGATNEAVALLHCFPLPKNSLPPPKKKRYLRAPPGIPLAPPLICALPSLPVMFQSPQTRIESRAARRAGLGAKHGGAGAAESVLALFQRAWPPLFNPPPPSARAFSTPTKRIFLSGPRRSRQRALSFGSARFGANRFFANASGASPRRACRRPSDGGPCVFFWGGKEKQPLEPRPERLLFFIVPRPAPPFRAARPIRFLELLAREQTIGFLVLGQGLLNHVIRDVGRRRTLVPPHAFEVVAHELLVERRLRPTHFVFA